jgi:hypothetical protein
MDGDEQMSLTNRRKIDEIREVEDEILNEWELAFIKAVDTADELGRDLSEKQQACLDRLYEKACRSPY